LVAGSIPARPTTNSSSKKRSSKKKNGFPREAIFLSSKKYPTLKFEISHRDGHRGVIKYLYTMQFSKQRRMPVNSARLHAQY
jgi:hypothetical protein